MDIFQPTVGEALDFLAELTTAGLSYSAINTARCALSSVLLPFGGTPFGCLFLVKKFVKGVFELNPPRPRYSWIWDVKIVLCYLQSLDPLAQLTLKDLTLKLVMLTALVTAKRGQTLHLLDLKFLTKAEGYVFEGFDNHLKQSRPSTKTLAIHLRNYLPDTRLCVVKTLEAYLDRTSDIRGEETRLVISFSKPHRKVSRDTITRWIKTVLCKAGIDTKVFKAHSTRAAAVSAAKRGDAPLHDI